MPRAQDAHDCRDAGGRATQEQLPRSGVCQFCTILRMNGSSHMDVRREASLGPHMCLVRSKLSSGGAGAGIVLPGHGTSTSL